MASLTTEAPTSDDDLKRRPRGCLLFTKCLTVVLNVLSIIILAVSPGVPNIPAGMGNTSTEDFQSSLESIYTTRRNACIVLIVISTVTTLAQITIACCGCSDGECKTCLVIIEKINVSLLTAIAGVGYNNTISWPTIIVFSWASD
ncbi:hypothetical protein AKJ16_DCAP25259, partial [Drosera capensis]